MEKENGNLFTIDVCGQESGPIEQESQLIFIDKKKIFIQSDPSFQNLVFNLLGYGNLSTMEKWLGENGFDFFNIKEDMPEVLRQYVINNTTHIICSKYRQGISREVYISAGAIDNINRTLGLQVNQR